MKHQIVHFYSFLFLLVSGLHLRISICTEMLRPDLLSPNVSPFCPMDPPCQTDRYKILHVGCHSERNHACQFW